MGQSISVPGTGIQMKVWYDKPYPPYCPDLTYYQAYQSMTGYYDVPVRPDRRPKPVCLRCNLTSRGPYQKWTRTARITKSYAPPVALACNGQAATRQMYYQYYDLCGVDPPVVEVPSTSISLRNQIKSAQVSLAETIGEWRETQRAVSGGASALSRAASDLRNIAKSPRRTWPKKLRRMWKDRSPKDLNLHTVPASYVVTQYGVLPWIDLANQSIDALNARGQDLALVKVFRQRRSRTRTKTVKGTYGGSLVTKKTVNVYSVAYVTYYKDIGTFTSGNIGESIWAGLPASFMVDWFYGIGQWLSAIDALDGVRSYTGCTTVRTEVTASDRRIEHRYGSSSQNHLVQAGRYASKTYQRSGLSLAMPALPEWKVSASWGKLVSSMALLDVLRHKR